MHKYEEDFKVFIQQDRENWILLGEKSNVEKCEASIQDALDEVDNTVGHYVSYLAKWSPRSFNNVILKLPKRFKIISENNVICDDIFNTIKNNFYDLAYFDPPYGSNNEKMPSSRVRYNSYYHI